MYGTAEASKTGSSSDKPENYKLSYQGNNPKDQEKKSTTP